MTPPTVFALINESKIYSDADVQRMAAVLGKQLALHLAPVHGLVPGVVFVPNGTQPPAGACPTYILPKSDVPGAGGYHDEDGSGVPYIKVFDDATDGTLVGPASMPVVLSHEMGEVVGDWSANLWAEAGDGTEHAYELCDATEDDVYEIDGMSVSNFLYRAFFDPKAEKGSRFDYLGVVTQPFATRPKGYQIVRAITADASDVFGRLRARGAAADGDEVRPIGHGVFLHFGAGFYESRKAGKVAKAVRRRSRMRP